MSPESNSSGYHRVPRSFGRLSLLALFGCWMGMAGPVLAHQPHDPVRAAALSPGFSKDNRVLAAVHPAATFIFGGVSLLISDNGGLSFHTTPHPIAVADFDLIRMAPGVGGETTVYASHRKKGLFRSVDGGLSWEEVDVGIPGVEITALVVSPAYLLDGTLFVGTADGVVLRSTDKGTTWKSVYESQDALSSISDIILSPRYFSDGVAFFAVSDKGVFRSDDRGKRWNRLLFSGQISKGLTHLALSADFDQNPVVLVGTQDIGVLRSDDGGTTWAKANTGLPADSVVDLVVTRSNAMFLIMNEKGIYRSLDSGQSWKPVNKGLRPLDPNHTEHFFDIAVSSDPDAADSVLVASWEGLYYSRTLGNKWLQLNVLPPTVTRALDISRRYATDGTLFAATYGGGIVKSEDEGQSWTGLNRNGIDNMFPDPLKMSPEFVADQTVFAGVTGGDSGGAGKTTDGGNSWTFVPFVDDPNPYGRRLAVSPDYGNDGTVFAISRKARNGRLIYQAVHRSEDGGTTWRELGVVLDSLLTEIAISPDYARDRTVVVAALRQGLLMSTDRGETWKPLAYKELAGLIINRVVFSPAYATDRTLFVGTRSKGVMKSTDGGNTWQTISNGLDHLDVNDISVSPGYPWDPTLFCAAANGGVYKSVNGGATWVQHSNGLIPNITLFVLQSPDYPQDQTVFAGTYKGIYKSTDGGQNWVRAQNYVQHDDMNHAIHYHGEWQTVTDSACVSGGCSRASAAGSEAHFQFTGTTVIWIGSKGPDHGVADVYLDGRIVGTVDLYAAQPVSSTAIYQLSGLQPGLHSLEIEVLGAANPSSSGTLVGIDAFDVLE